MTKPKGKDAVILITRNSIEFFGSNVGGVAAYVITDKAVRDLTVVNEDLLINEIKEFVRKMKIAPAMITLVFSDSASFMKDIPKSETGTETNLINEFIGSVPLDSKLVKEIKMPKATRVVVVNRDIYEAIQFGLEQQGFLIKCALPAFSIGTGFEQAVKLDTNFGKLILERAPKLTDYYLVSEESIENSEVKDFDGEAQLVMPKKTGGSKKRLLVLGVVFLLLVMVLGWLVLGR